MPGGKDIAALPTSWALTLWDALPIFLSIECALAVVILALLGGSHRYRTWQVSRHHVAAGVAYLTFFDLWLAAACASLGIVAIALTAVAPPGDTAVDTPASPTSGLTNKLWEVLGGVALAAAIAAVIKVLLGATLGTGSALWFPLAAVTGYFAPLSLGSSAIPGLAIASSSGFTLAGAVWLFAAATQRILPVAVSAVRLHRAAQYVERHVTPSQDA